MSNYFSCMPLYLSSAVLRPPMNHVFTARAYWSTSAKPRLSWGINTENNVCLGARMKESNSIFLKYLKQVFFCIFFTHLYDFFCSWKHILWTEIDGIFFLYLISNWYLYLSSWFFCARKGFYRRSNPTWLSTCNTIYHNLLKPLSHIITY